jgi:hypothetical protein
VSGKIVWNMSYLRQNGDRKRKKQSLVEGPVRRGREETRFPAVGKIRRKASEKVGMTQEGTARKRSRKTATARTALIQTQVDRNTERPAKGEGA